MYCRKCGNYIPDDSDFCPKCGATLKETPQQHNERIAAKNEIIQRKKQKRAKVLKAVFIPLGILAVLAAFIVPYVYWEYHLDFYYTLSDGDRYIITGYKGSDTDVKIPATIQFTPVYMVAANAFKESDITSVTFGKNIGAVGESAFEGCKELKTVSFAQDSNSTVDNIVIMDRAFENCPSLYSVDLPNSKIHILNRAFAECSNLSGIGFNCVYDIGEKAFLNCIGLGSLDLYNECTVGESAFSGCTGITYLDIGSNITLGMKAFDECTGLKELTYKGDNIAFFGFSNCTALEKVNWHRSFSDETGIIENFAFNDCTSLSSIVYTDSTHNMLELTKPSDFDSLNVSLLGDPFYGCSIFKDPEPEKKNLYDYTVYELSEYTYNKFTTEFGMPDEYWWGTAIYNVNKNGTNLQFCLDFDLDYDNIDSLYDIPAYSSAGFNPYSNSLISGITIYGDEQITVFGDVRLGKNITYYEDKFNMDLYSDLEYTSDHGAGWYNAYVWHALGGRKYHLTYMFYEDSLEAFAVKAYME